RWLSDALREMLDKETKGNDVVLFMKGTPDAPRCGYSRAAVQILQVNGVDMAKLKAYDVLSDEDLRTGIKEYSNWPTIPQIYVKGEFLGGADILYNMHNSGELEQLLVKEGIVPKSEE
ncbi:thioredoxin-like protein, partial [Hyaloraphidium curvatum]